MEVVDLWPAASAAPARNTGIVVALREVGAFADQPGTLGVNTAFAATAEDMAARRPICPLDPECLRLARKAGPLDGTARGLYRFMNARFWTRTGRYLPLWDCLPQATRNVLSIVLIGRPLTWVSDSTACCWTD